jgi:uncharacterized GH25 family protein
VRFRAPYRRRFSALSAAAFLFPGSVLAHDLWLLPPSPPLRPAEPVVLRAATGMDFPQSESAVAPERIVRVLARLPDGKEISPRDLGTEGAFLAVRLPPPGEGTTVAAIETAPRVLRLSAEEFNEYLKEDGLPETLAWREKEGRLGEASVERYAKFAKAIFRVGEGGATDAATKPLGLPLEIVPLADPTRLEPGGTLRIRVLFRGEPLAGALVGSDRPGTGAGFVGTLKTDEKGEAEVELPESGPFTLRLVKMTRPALEDYEWESFWASLTF